MKLTKWFPGHIKPVRKGVYMQRCGHRMQDGYQYWNGKEWGCWFESPEFAYKYRNYVVGLKFQNYKWRGLAEKPA